MPTAALRGLRDADDARRFLLDRRESLRAAALCGDLVVGGTPQEIQFQRLTCTLERLERRLPPPTSLRGG